MSAVKSVDGIYFGIDCIIGSHFNNKKKGL